MAVTPRTPSASRPPADRPPEWLAGGTPEPLRSGLMIDIGRLVELLRGRGLRAAAPRLPPTLRVDAAAVYLPACVNRIFGRPRGEARTPSLPAALVALSERAGLPLWIPGDVAGHCGGTPWSSKGFLRGQAHMAERTAQALQRWTVGGRLPVVVDATACTHRLREQAARAGVEIIDSVEWVHDHLLARLEVTRKLGTVAVHPTCRGHELGAKLEAIAARMADEVVIHAGSGGCAMQGERGGLHGEPPASALHEVARELVLILEEVTDGASPTGGGG